MAQKGKLKKAENKDDPELRPPRWRRYDQLFLIVCEDQKTEPYYFEGFRKLFPEETLFLRAFGAGRDPKGVVEQAIIERENLQNEANKHVDEVWVVFDKDDANLIPANTLRFNDAFNIAQTESIKVAYSNESFELWLLLHFIEIIHTAPIPRLDIYADLEAAIRSFPSHAGFIYDHGKTEVIDAVSALGNENLAIERAKQLFELQAGIPPIQANPSTKVYLLVKQLRSLLEWYQSAP